MFKRLFLGTATGIAAYHVYLLPHTIFLEKYRSKMCRQRLSKEIPVKKVLLQRFQEVMDDLKLPDDIRKLIRPFNIIGFAIDHAGTLNPKYGAIVGLPENFICEDFSAISKLNLMINFRHPNWESEAGQKFLHSLLLSEDAQKYVIAREILRIQNHEFELNAYTLAAIIAGMYTISGMIEAYLAKAGSASQSSTAKTVTRTFEQKSKHAAQSVNETVGLKLRPNFRYTLYITLCVIGTCMWLGIKDLFSCKFDRENDQALAELGIKYIQGGKEFYEKVLIGNIALRTLCKPEGEHMFTPYGNEKFFIRQKRVAFSERKKFFESKLQHLQ